MKNIFSKPHPALPYILPFATFLALTGITSLIPGGLVWIYPLKTVVVGFLLLKFWHVYTEVHVLGDFMRLQSSLLAFLVGLGVFGIWILPEDILGWNYPLLGKPSEFNPEDQFQSKSWAVVWIGVRLFGAAVVVPAMEELFWRSFLIRYLIQPDFREVRIGTFSWLSFGATVFLFGMEHQRWLVGILAGVIYNLLLYRTKSVFACILAHAVTNLVLGIYVLITLRWSYW